MATISAPDFDSSVEFRVVYRPVAHGWITIIFCALAMAWSFWAAMQPSSYDAITAEDLVKNRVENNAIFVWLAFTSGTVLLLLLPVLVWNQLFFRLLADENGLRWRPFIAWQSARWAEVTKCLLKPVTNDAQIFIGKRQIDLNTRNPQWPVLRDFVAARVRLTYDAEPWHEPLVISAEERRAQTPANDDGAPIEGHSPHGCLSVLFALMMALMGAIYLVPDIEGEPPPLWVWVFGFVFFIVFPLVAQWRCFVRADDAGLLLAGMVRRRRFRWDEIEDLFFLPSLRSDRLPRKCIVVAGETIELSALGRSRDAILNRIEARAIHSKSPRFEEREFAPVGADLPMPATLDFRAGFRLTLRNCALLVLLVAGSGAGIAALIADIGWANFGDTRAIIVLGAAGYAWMSWSWGQRALRHLLELRARGDAQIRVDQQGLTLTENGASQTVAWADVVRLESEHDLVGGADYRVEGANGSAIEWSLRVPRGNALARLLRERSGLSWQKSARVWREQFGISRQGEAVTFSLNNSNSRLPMWTAFGVWAFTLLPTFSSYGDIGAALLWMLSFPLGMFLYFAIAVYFGARRIWARCDARGLTRQGLFRRSFIAWEDAEEIGSNNICDWVRARDGKTVELWGYSAANKCLARRELRAEIRRRAPHATGDWEIK